MSPASWQELYGSGGQFPWAVMVVPFAFLLYRALARDSPERALEPALAPFVARWTTLFTLAALIDPLATGPLAEALRSPLAARALAIAFVLLGDFRVYWLVLRLRASEQTDGRAALEAAALSAIAPVLAGWVALCAWPAQATWLAHELASLALAFALARLAAPSELTHARRAAFVRSVLGAMAAYYGLWAAADVLILCGVDAGWLVRFVPNQLYYGLFVPFVWARFFGARAEAARA
jgi:hypothetical protein